MYHVHKVFGTQKKVLFSKHIEYRINKGNIGIIGFDSIQTNESESALHSIKICYIPLLINL